MSDPTRSAMPISQSVVSPPPPPFFPSRLSGGSEGPAYRRKVLDMHLDTPTNIVVRRALGGGCSASGGAAVAGGGDCGAGGGGPPGSTLPPAPPHLRARPAARLQLAAAAVQGARQPLRAQVQPRRPSIRLEICESAYIAFKSVRCQQRTTTHRNLKIELIPVRKSPHANGNCINKHPVNLADNQSPHIGEAPTMPSPWPWLTWLLASAPAGPCCSAGASCPAAQRRLTDGACRPRQPALHLPLHLKRTSYLSCVWSLG